jgi:hypothetical protein
MATRLYQDFVGATTNATPLVIATVAVPTNASWTLEGNITGRRTGGSSGNAGDTAGYVIKGIVKNIAGTVTVVTQGLVICGEDQSSWNATLTASGANMLLTVTGAANNIISWTVYLNMYEAS